ncbi:MAG: hypothetical protein RIQ89_931 [Bacteroidota bacterium]
MINGESTIHLPKIIIAIDGYSSCGKSTLAKALARALGYRFIDSGAMYRAVTLSMVEENIGIETLLKFDDQEMKEWLDNIHITFAVNEDTGFSEVQLNGVNVERKIRDIKISDLVSPVSALPMVRHRMVALQKSYGTKKSVVMDGRDIGTTVFPTAELKIFMTARPAVRAKRRFEELNAKGFMVTMDEVYDNINNRDYADTHRKESPLRQAEDAILLDNSDMNEQEQLQFALDAVLQVKKKLGN